MSSAQAEEAGVSPAAETSSPIRQAPERETGIDKLGLAIEVAKAHGKVSTKLPIIYSTNI